MTYQEAVSYIHARKRFNGPPTLDRMRRLMVLLGDPQERLRIVHIAGTNGKGSTAVMTAAILRAAGLRTGLTVSPFITDFCERIQIDGVPIAREALAREMTRIAPLAEQVGGMTEFELITAAAYSYFADSGCSAVVAEVGLGGRFDATNVISRPLVSVITRIGLDHTAVLGGTLGEIAFEKCGIIKPGIPVVTCGEQDPDALAVIMEQCAKQGCVLSFGNPGAVSDAKMTLDGTDFAYQGMRLHLPLLGRHQITNAVTAITAAEQALPSLIGHLPDERMIADALAGVRMPARFEIVRRDPLVIIDGAHNPQAAGALAEALTLLGDRPVTGVVGVLADKDSAGLLGALAPRLARVLCVTPESPRALGAHELAVRADAVGLRASAAHGIDEALNLAQAVASAQAGAVVVCGSLLFASQVRARFVDVG
ncbi:folylpolyglutamate synthase/dihydrofolate synthase family protein [Anaerotruncus colihominis]|uniref:bifunctional folylpolyglutamate synthase/dihydrofolate synthase n=1 Tax=Anaerotruncus colihominis TaxID=169435 RepID=UPI0026EA861C|nr:folylpolyglutamate synthase/dihydrofolate synthase family protein [Anaerotruncus colihominis]